MGELRLPHCIVLPNQSMTGANFTLFSKNGKFSVVNASNLGFNDTDIASDSYKPPASAGGFERDDKEHSDYMHPFRGGANFPFRHAEEKREGGGRG
ncbi:hypothetical protein C1H46_000079 [Malus baccata]|uniref:Uncharacterized protein n=1 Tax=Malus baccata TaxID=106549 RepID=A0A540NUH4_MALBA|nr:hypothetical protein C1H46_000079 [Malus baccata]